MWFSEFERFPAHQALDGRQTGLKFEDGSELEADVVVFCTGLVKFCNNPILLLMIPLRSLADPDYAVRDIFGEDGAKRIPKIWGLNEEGELNGVFKETGYSGLYVMMGTIWIQ